MTIIPPVEELSEAIDKLIEDAVIGGTDDYPVINRASLIGDLTERFTGQHRRAAEAGVADDLTAENGAHVAALKRIAAHTNDTANASTCAKIARAALPEQLDSHPAVPLRTEAAEGDEADPVAQDTPYPPATGVRVSDEMKEAAARAICEMAGGSPDKNIGSGYVEWHRYLSQASAALDAALSALVEQP